MSTINILGPLKVTAPDGTDITPKGKKARGLLALLAVSPDHKRTRGWIQDKLWSDRAEKQGAASLRHTVWQIRKSFGKHDLLKSVDECLYLSSVSVRADRHSQGLSGNDLELFDGLDVKDAEFETWLREQRQQVDKIEKAAKKPLGSFAVLLLRHSDLDGEANALTKSSSHRLMAYFRDKFGAEVLLANTGLDSSASFDLDIRLAANIETIKVRGGYIWSLEISDFNSKFSVCSQSQYLAENIEFEEKVSKINELILKLAFRLEAENTFWRLSVPRDAYRARALNKARSLLFALDKQSLVSAELILSTVPRESCSPDIYAWRAMLRNISWFQYRETSFLGDGYDEWRLLDLALQGRYPNSTTYCVAALVENLGGSSVKKAVQLARAAYEMNPVDPLSAVILSNCLISVGEIENALTVARSLGKSMPLNSMQPYLDFFGCMAEEANGNYQEAIVQAERSLDGLPIFRSPKRHLVALYRATGQIESSEKMVRQLRSEEPDFSESRMLDDDYPTPTLRRIRLADVLGK